MAFRKFVFGVFATGCHQGPVENVPDQQKQFAVDADVSFEGSLSVGSSTDSGGGGDEQGCNSILLYLP